jgi:hypothetical protein
MSRIVDHWDLVKRDRARAWDASFGRHIGQMVERDLEEWAACEWLSRARLASLELARREALER